MKSKFILVILLNLVALKNESCVGKTLSANSQSQCVFRALRDYPSARWR
jgi:hypothetical protein